MGVGDFFRKWFRPKPVRKPSSIDIKTAPLSEEQLRAVTREEMKVQPSQYIAACAQSVGLQRDHNEDSLFMLNTILADGANDIPFGIFIVADGMGGHEHGEVASSTAARVMADHLISRLYRRFLGIEARPQPESLQEIMEGGVAESQAAVTNRAPGGGTTLTAALAVGDQIVLAHVGDSRAYLILPSGEIHPITQDHTYVQRMIELGNITEEEARVHPQRNVLYRAVGQTDPLHPDVHTHLLPHPGYLMICSDGLWGVVPDAEIFRIIHASATVVDACQKLVDAANQEGGPDNISVVLVQYPD